MNDRFFLTVKKECDGKQFEDYRDSFDCLDSLRREVLNHVRNFVNVDFIFFPWSTSRDWYYLIFDSVINKTISFDFHVINDNDLPDSDSYSFCCSNKVFKIQNRYEFVDFIFQIVKNFK